MEGEEVRLGEEMREGGNGGRERSNGGCACTVCQTCTKPHSSLSLTGKRKLLLYPAVTTRHDAVSPSMSP